MGHKGFPDTKRATTKSLFEDVWPSTVFSIRHLDIGQEFSGYKRKEKKTEYVVSCTEHGKERKKLVQVLLAICLARCVNEEVLACIW